MKSKVIIREPKMQDAPQLLNLINSLVEEKAYIAIQNKQTMANEKKWLKNVLKDIKNKTAVCLILEVNSKILGSSSVNKGLLTANQHTGEIGIIIHKEARGLDLGKKLFQEVITKTKKDLKLKIITLNLFKTNNIALNLYKKSGFVIVGKIKKGYYHFGKYYDEILMVKYL